MDKIGKLIASLEAALDAAQDARAAGYVPQRTGHLFAAASLASQAGRDAYALARGI